MRRLGTGRDRLVWPIVMGSMGLPGVAFAQATPPLTGSIPSRGQVQTPATPAEPAAPQVSFGNETASGAEGCSLDAFDKRVSIDEIVFEGGDGGAVRPALAPLLSPRPAAGEAGDQPISVVCRIRDRINGVLAQAGYLARVQVKAQDLLDHKLKLAIVSGRVTEFRVRGNLGRFNGALDRRLEQIRRLDPFNKDEAVRILLLAREIPGLKVRMTLRNANARPGDLIADIDAQATTATVIANAQNFGSRELGREVATLRAEVYGLTGLADRTYASVSNSFRFREIHVAELGHDFALGDSGLRLSGHVSVAQSQPQVPGLDLQSRSLIGGADIYAPVIRTERWALDSTIGLEIMNQSTRFRSAGVSQLITQDRTRVLFSRLSGQYRMMRGNEVMLALDGYFEARKGLALLSATLPGRGGGGGIGALSRAEGRAKAGVLRAELGGTLLPESRFSLEARAFGQFTSSPLLNLEEFAIGSFTYGRGYDPGSNSGDRALAFRLEPRAKVATVGPVEVSASAFFDWVHLWNLDRTAGAEASRVLRSTGGGLRALWRSPASGEVRAVLDVTYAKPLNQAIVTARAGRPPARLLVSLTTRFGLAGGN